MTAGFNMTHRCETGLVWTIHQGMLKARLTFLEGRPIAQVELDKTIVAGEFPEVVRGMRRTAGRDETGP